jgi:uncharacterized iron-regulated protein
MSLRLAALAAALAALSSAAPALAGPELPLTAASEHPLAGRILRTADGAALTADELARDLAAADVAVLGETHDNPDHHAAQAWLVAAMAAGGLAFEMFAPGREGALARARAEGGDIGAALAWADSGWPDWAMYAPIFAAAPDAALTGGAVERPALGAAMREGAAAAAPAALGAAARLYRLDRGFDGATQAAAVAEQVAAHCDAIPAEMAVGMVEAQRLRDAALADATLRARAQAADGPVALIAGAGHARLDRGAPAFLRAAAPDISVAALALLEVAEGREDWRDYAARGADAPVFDYLWFTAPAPREDPCEAFLRSRR